jgi:peptidylamidoglycolate lyase
MIRFAALLAVCLMLAAVLAEDILGQGEFRYRVVPNWGREALAQVNVKNGHAVAIDAQGRLLFLTDDARRTTWSFSTRRAGALIKHWTARMPGAHGMSLVKEGKREVLFITDTQLHEVRKLTLDGEELAVFPWPEKAKLHADAKEYRPSKTIHFPHGEFAVFDGYGKDYIFHYKADGSLLRAWGGNLGDPEDQLKHWGPHGGAFDDRDPGTPRVVIGMSDQQEIRRFTPEGRFIDKIAVSGRESA